MAADGGARRGVLAVLTALLVVAAVTVAALDLTGRLPGGLVADPASSPTATPTLDPPRSPAPEVLAAEPTAPGPAPVLPEAALDAVLASPALGGAAGAAVLDVATGQVLLDRDAGAPRIPASVAKLATAAAVLSAYDPGHRVTTRVLAGADGSGGNSMVLVGAGDATLTSRNSRPGDLPQRASLADLADQVVAALPTGRTPGPLTVRVDDSLFTGPAVSPDWPATYVSSGVVSPVSALSVDAGRVRHGSVARETDPALAAGSELARLLRRRGFEVNPDVTRGPAPAGAAVLAEAESPTVAEMAEFALQTSDNDVAEALLRLAAIGQELPATFDGGTTAALDALASLGVPTEGVTLLDGSGLARGSAVPPDTLARLLLLACRRCAPRSRALARRAAGRRFQRHPRGALRQQVARHGRRRRAGEDRDVDRCQRARGDHVGGRSPRRVRRDVRPGARRRHPAGTGRPRQVYGRADEWRGRQPEKSLSQG